jgi:tetratricopeptide (TPR) repeat protein
VREDPAVRWDETLELTWRRLVEALDHPGTAVVVSAAPDPSDVLRRRIARRLKREIAHVVDAEIGDSLDELASARSALVCARWRGAEPVDLRSWVDELPPTRAVLVLGVPPPFGPLLTACGDHWTLVALDGAPADRWTRDELVLQDEDDVGEAIGLVDRLLHDPRPTDEPGAGLTVAFEVARRLLHAEGLDPGSRLAVVMALVRAELHDHDLAGAADHLTLARQAAAGADGILTHLLLQSLRAVRDSGDHAAVLELADEVRVALDDLAAAHPGAVPQDVHDESAGCLFDWRAEAAEHLSDFEEARSNWEASLARRDAVVRWRPDDPDALKNLARACNGLGRLLDRLERPGALPLFERSLELRRRQLQLEGWTVSGGRDLAGNFVFVGDAMARQGDRLAVAMYDEATAIERRIIGEVGPDPRVLDGLATSLGRAARQRRKLGELDVASALGRERVEVQRQAVSLVDDTRMLRNLHVALTDLVNIERDLGNLDASAQLSAQALDLARRLVAVEPAWQIAVEDLAVSLAQVAHDHEVAGDVHGARDLLDESAAVRLRYRALVGDTPRAVNLIAESCRDRARVCRALGDEAQVLALLDEVVELREHAVELAGPTLERRRLLAQSVREAAQSRLRLDGATAALPQLRAAEEQFRELLHVDGDRPDRFADLAGVLTDIGNAHISAGDLAAAEAAHREAIELHDTRLTSFTPTPAARRSRSVSRNNLARVVERQGQPRRALALYETSLQERLALLPAAPTPEDHRSIYFAAQGVVLASARAGRITAARAAAALAHEHVDLLRARSSAVGTVLGIRRALAYVDGFVEERAGDLTAATREYEGALGLAEELRSTAPGPVNDGLRADAVREWARTAIPSGERDTLIVPRLELALERARVALDREDSEGERAKVVDALFLLASVRFRAGELEHARVALDEGRALGSQVRDGGDVQVARLRIELELLDARLTARCAPADPEVARRIATTATALAERAPDDVAVQALCIDALLWQSRAHIGSGDGGEPALAAAQRITSARERFDTELLWAPRQVELDQLGHQGPTEPRSPGAR